MLRLVKGGADGALLPELTTEQRMLHEQRARRGMSEDAGHLWNVLRYVSALRGTSEDLSRDLASHHGSDEVRAQLTGALVYLTRFARELEQQETRRG